VFEVFRCGPGGPYEFLWNVDDAFKDQIKPKVGLMNQVSHRYFPFIVLR